MILDQPDSAPKAPRITGVIVWMCISFVLAMITSVWLLLGSDFGTVFLSSAISWLSFLLAVGYYSTPSGTWQGKAAFAGVCVMISGISFKVLHLPGSHELIVVGLGLTVAFYGLHWIKKTGKKSEETKE